MEIDLAITPGGRVGDASPLGHKGGKRRLVDYVREVAHALMRKRGFTKSHAIATAKNALKRWRRGGGHVRPQVRAGAAAALGRQAALDHRHSWETTVEGDLDWSQEIEPLTSIELAEVMAIANAIADTGTLDLATTVVHRYRHGWIPLGDAGRTKRRAPKGRAKARFDKLHSAAMREAARRQLAATSLRGPGRAPNGPKATSPKGWDGEAKSHLASTLVSHRYPQFSNVVNDARAIARERGLDLSWNEKLHPRDWRGRFMHKGGAVHALETAATEQRYREHVKNVDKTIIKLAPTMATENMPEHATKMPDGSIRWSKERQAMHRKLVEAEFRKQVRQGAQKDGKAIFLGGLPGAGKTRGLENKFGDVESQYVTVNPDIFKERMAHMGLTHKVEGLSPLEASAFHHEESATMAQMLAERAMRGNYNVIHDITMNSPGSVTKRLKPLHDRGYSTHAMFLDIPLAMSQKSVEKRHRNGWLASQADPTGRHIGQRLVPSSHIASGRSDTGSNSKNRDAFDATKHLFDSYDLFDNNNYAMRPIEIKTPKGRIHRSRAA